MSTPSPVSTVLFLLLVGIVAVLVLFSFRRAGMGPAFALGILVLYIGVPGILARVGALDRYNPLPAPALLLLLCLLALTALLVFSQFGTRLAAAVTVGSVVALQTFRIPVEWWLHRLYGEGIVPVQMTYAGRNYDVITGVTGLLLGGWLLSGRPVPRSVVLAWNLLGLGLLVNIVSIAILSTRRHSGLLWMARPISSPAHFPGCGCRVSSFR